MSKNQETLISNAIIKHVQKNYPKVWIHKNVVAKAKLGSGFYSNVGIGVGSPDLILCVEGRFVGFETKTPEGKASDEQVKWGNMIRSKGGVYEIVRCIQDATRVLDSLAKGDYTASLLC